MVAATDTAAVHDPFSVPAPVVVLVGTGHRTVRAPLCPAHAPCVGPRHPPRVGRMGRRVVLWHGPRRVGPSGDCPRGLTTGPSLMRLPSPPPPSRPPPRDPCVRRRQHHAPGPNTTRRGAQHHGHERVHRRACPCTVDDGATHQRPSSMAPHMDGLPSQRRHRVRRPTLVGRPGRHEVRGNPRGDPHDQPSRGPQRQCGGPSGRHPRNTHGPPHGFGTLQWYQHTAHVHMAYQRHGVGHRRRAGPRGQRDRHLERPHVHDGPQCQNGVQSPVQCRRNHRTSCGREGRQRGPRTGRRRRRRRRRRERGGGIGPTGPLLMVVRVDAPKTKGTDHRPNTNQGTH